MVTGFFCALTHEGIIAVEGIDSKKFLQGQLTCHLDYLTTEKASLGARCTPKGRMISTFRIVEQTNNNYLLSLDSTLIPLQLDDFKKYAIFSKVNLIDVSAQWLRFGIQATTDELAFLNLTLPVETNQIVHFEDYFIIKISEQRYELWISADATTNITTQLAEHLPQHPLNDWLLGQIQAGIGQIFLETTELFIPQMINLQAVGGVSFKKGCYTGQEIVARMQYLGKLKRHLYHFSLSDEELPAKGCELFSTTHNTSVGQVVLAAKTANNTIELLAVVQDDATAAQLWLKDKQTKPLKLLSLPYQLNSQEEIKY